MTTEPIFAELSNAELADAINEFLDVHCWTESDVAEWREMYLEAGYMPTTYDDFPAIAGDEHSNLSFIWFLEDNFIGIDVIL